MNTQQQLMDVPVWAIDNGLNNRESFPTAHITALADSIRTLGLQQPPVYRRRADGRYQIVAGECRTIACRDVLGWDTITALVVDVLDDEGAHKRMLTENLRRVQPNPLEEARGYRTGMDAWGWTVADAASGAGVSESQVKDRVALLTLNADAQDLIARGTLKPEYGLILAKAELPAMFQNRALDLLRDNPSPNLVWWRATVSEVKGLADQPDMFADVQNWGHYAATKRADVQEDLPLPWTHSAPSAPGEDARTTLVRQITFWTRASEQWQARGKKQHMQACGGAAWQLNAVLQRMDAGTLPGLATY